MVFESTCGMTIRNTTRAHVEMCTMVFDFTCGMTIPVDSNTTCKLKYNGTYCTAVQARLKSNTMVQNHVYV